MAEAIDEKLLKELCKQYSIRIDFVKKILKEAPSVNRRQWLESQIEAEARISVEEEKL